MLLGARLALGAAALAVVACCVHVKHVYGAPVRLAESAVFALALAGAIATGALVADLTLAALAVLAVLLVVVGPTVAVSARD
jgi:hypothetical protein